MKPKEKERAEQKIIRKYLEQERKRDSYGIQANLKKAYEIKGKMEKVLESTKITKMADAKHEKLYGMFCSWVEVKNREFNYLKR